MEIGKYYVDNMPVGDDTNDTYCVVYSEDPNETPASEVGNFTVTEGEEKAYGSLDAAIIAYMRRNYPDNGPRGEQRLYILRARKRELQGDIRAMILDLLSRCDKRITSFPVPDEDGCVEYPITMALYRELNSPMISLTSVYLDSDGILKADGDDEVRGTTERGFQLYPEHYAWALDFITLALGYPSQTDSTLK